MTLPRTMLEKPPRSASRVASCVCALLATVALSGCASQGPLRPPSLHLPAPVRGLAADRVGDAVDLRWTAPTRTTDGLPLNGKHVPGPLQVEICRQAGSTVCAPLGRMPVGSTLNGSFHDVLPAPLASGPARLLRYRVLLLNGDGRGAAPAAVETLAGSAPAPIAEVQAAPTENGVLIRWKAGSPAETGRILLRVRRGGAVAGAPAAKAGQKSDETLLAVESRNGDPAGTLDTGAKLGMAQAYSIVRERTVRLGGSDLIMTGTPVPVSIAADARLPALSPPTGLEAVVNTLGTPEIDLAWQLNPAASGYRIYRAENTGLPVLLTAQPVQALSYSDTAVRPGVRYRYSVASVGRDGITGPGSSEIEEHLPDR